VGIAAAILLITLVVPALANASVSAPLAWQRTATFAQRTQSLQQHINVLLKRVSREHRRAAPTSSVVRTSERVIVINHQLVRLNRLALSEAVTDQATLKAVLALDRRLIRVDQATLRTDRQARLGHGSHLVARVTELKARLSTVRGRVWRWRHTQPTPSAPDPAPTPTPTTSPTPDPSPSATPTASPAPITPPSPAPGTTTISGEAFTTYTVPAGSHDVDYVNCTFTSSSSTAAALTIATACYDLTFTDCTFGPSTAWNDVSIAATNGNIHDITFAGCTFSPAARMDFECIQRPTSNTVGYHHIDLVDCVFQPAGEEAISYDGGFFDANCLISGCTVLGSNNSASPQYYGELEINGPTDFQVENCIFDAAQCVALNLEGPPGADCKDVFTNDVIDWSVLKQSYPTGSNSRLTEFQNLNDAVFDNCTFNTGNAANHAYNAGYWTNSSSNDLSTSTVTGTVRTLPTPTKGADYFSLDSNCLANMMPAHP
jgi:hypothetical protein